MNKFIEAVYKKHTDDISEWEWDLITSTPQGAYDAVGNLVNVGDKVLRIKDHKKGQIQTVVAIEKAGYEGTQNICVDVSSWPRMYNIIKI